MLQHRQPGQRTTVPPLPTKLTLSNDALAAYQYGTMYIAPPWWCATPTRSQKAVPCATFSAAATHVCFAPSAVVFKAAVRHGDVAVLRRNGATLRACVMALSAAVL
jgi:hypothetical protein